MATMAGKLLMEHPRKPVKVGYILILLKGRSESDLRSCEVIRVPSIQATSCLLVFKTILLTVSLAIPVGHL